jgi:hypothetical protein
MMNLHFITIKNETARFESFGSDAISCVRKSKKAKTSLAVNPILTL